MGARCAKGLQKQSIIFYYGAQSVINHGVGLQFAGGKLGCG